MNPPAPAIKAVPPPFACPSSLLVSVLMEEETIRAKPIERPEALGTTSREWDLVDVLGVRIACVDQDATLSAIHRWLDSGERTYLCLTGVHGVMEARSDSAVATALAGAGMALPDGMPMVWAGRRAGSKAIQRVYGPELMLRVCRRAAESGWPVYFYGGRPGVAESLRERMSREFPSLEVAGIHSPPMREPGEPEDDEVIARITGSGARIVFVGISTPKQDLWMSNHLERIGGSVVLIGVGAAFDIHAGLKSDAPPWVGRIGLHWLYRLLQEPRRLWRRYFSIIPRYLAATLRNPPRLVARGDDRS